MRNAKLKNHTALSEDVLSDTTADLTVTVSVQTRARYGDTTVVTLYSGEHTQALAKLAADTEPVHTSILAHCVASPRRIAGSPKRRSLTNNANAVDVLASIRLGCGCEGRSGQCSPRSVLLSGVSMPLGDLYGMYCAGLGVKENAAVLGMLEAGGWWAEDGELAEGSKNHSFGVLEVLDLQGTYLGVAGCVPLLATLQHFGSLRILDLRGCGLTGESVTALQTALRCHPHLHTLHLTGNKIFEVGAEKVRHILAFNRGVIEMTLDTSGVSAVLLNKIRSQLSANAVYAQTRPGLVTSLPLPKPFLKELEQIWGALVAPPYVSPAAAMISVRFERFMHGVDHSFARYCNPGLRSLFKPRVDVLPTKQKIVSTGGVTFSVSFYSALLIGVSAILAPDARDAYETAEREALSRLGALYRAFGVRDFHLTEMIQGSVAALKGAGIEVSEAGRNAWTSALSIISASLVPSAYPS